MSATESVHNPCNDVSYQMTPSKCLKLISATTSVCAKDWNLGRITDGALISCLAQEFKKMSEKCFKKCISKPGSSLDSSEQKCIAMCMDRYMDAWNLVSRAYSNRLQRERHQ